MRIISKRSGPAIRHDGAARGWMPVPGARNLRVEVIGTPGLCEDFEPACLRQAANARAAPGVEALILNPDAHSGYGVPIGSVLVSPTHVYPGPVGVDIKCSMSLLQFDLPAEALRDTETVRRLIRTLEERVPTGPGRGARSVKKARRIAPDTVLRAVREGASPRVLDELGIPREWAARCEDARTPGRDRSFESLHERLDRWQASGKWPKIREKLSQLGSLGGGNHFGECEIVRVDPSPEARRASNVFGLEDGRAAFMTHCGSRGFGYLLALHHLTVLKERFQKRRLPLPGGDRELVYAEAGTPEAANYLDDLALAANFATVNHLVLNAAVREAFKEVFPGIHARFVYLIGHNVVRRERWRGKECWVHRKGATRAFPAGHPALAHTLFSETGHPVLLPGNPLDGSRVMAAAPGAETTCYSINHGAGRRMGRRAAFRALDQRTVDGLFKARGVLSNCRRYPLDEAPAAYKDFGEVVRSVERAGLARTVARLEARFVIKDADKSHGGAA